MNQYILLMHEEHSVSQKTSADHNWENYFHRLRASGRFDGGSAIAAGGCFCKVGSVRPITPHLTGFIRIRAESLEEACGFLLGNPVYEAGGNVEILELPSDA